jgi:hypothetical protein
MALSRNSPWVEVIGHQPYQGLLDLIIHDAPTLQVRIPEWVNENEIAVTADGKALKFQMMPNRYIQLQGLKPGDQLWVEYPLRQVPIQEMVSGQMYKVRWRGDTVVSISPEGKKYPIFQRSWMEKEQAPEITDNVYKDQLGGPVHW